MGPDQLNARIRGRGEAGCVQAAAGAVLKVLKSIFNGTASSRPSWFRKVRRVEKNTHLMGRLGIGSGEEFHAIADQSCRWYVLTDTKPDLSVGALKGKRALIRRQCEEK